MTKEDLKELLKNDPDSVKDLLREVVREENDKIETEKQTACSHTNSATLIDPKKGIIRCDDCALVYDLKMSESFKRNPDDIEQLPPLMQRQLEALKQRNAETSDS